MLRGFERNPPEELLVLLARDFILSVDENADIGSISDICRVLMLNSLFPQTDQDP